MDLGAARGALRSRKFGLPVLKRPSLRCLKLVDDPGSCSAVWHFDDGMTVLKAPLKFHLDGCDSHIKSDQHNLEIESTALLEREKEVYKHIGSHKCILKCLQISEIGLAFPYMKNGNLRHFLSSCNATISMSTKYAWIQSALAGFIYIHGRGILQADISARNFLVTDELSIVLCDFSGSLIGMKANLVRPETRYEKVEGDCPVAISLDTETFAIGSLIYELVTGKPPYSHIEDDEVADRFKSKQFPSTKGLQFGRIIERCWMGAFETAAEVLNAVVVLEHAER